MVAAKNDRIILGDWGNTAAKLFLVENGKVVAQDITSDGGVKSVIASHRLGMPKKLTDLAMAAKTSHIAQDQYKRELEIYNTLKAEIYASEAKKRIGDWLKENPKAPIVLCGAIGSREGWSFVSYIKCPADVTTLPENLYAIPKDHLGTLKDRNVYIVRGVKDLHPGLPLNIPYKDAHLEITGDHQSIMRGEEVKAFAVYDKLPSSQENLVCMPGTHSQWLSMSGTTINSFWSFRTGEMFQNMGNPSSSLHDVLSIRNGDETAKWKSFWEGVNIVGSGHGLLATSLGVRASVMTGDEGPESPIDYLSGIMVASEIMEGMGIYKERPPLTLIINPGRKADYYRAALGYFHYPIRQEFNGDKMSLEGLKRDQRKLNTTSKSNVETGISLLTAACRLSAFDDFYFPSTFVNSGTSWNRSPTRP